MLPHIHHPTSQCKARLPERTFIITIAFGEPVLDNDCK